MLPSDVLAFVRDLQRRDPRVRVGGASALALHEGRPPGSPIVVLASRAHRVPRALEGAVRVRRRARLRPPRTHEGVPVEPRIDAWLDALGGPGDAHDTDLLAATARALDVDELQEIARRARRAGCTAALARAAHLASRASGVPIAARPASPPVLLRPSGLRSGSVDRSTGVRVNAPDGLDASAPDATALFEALATALSRGDRALLVLGVHGVALDDALADGVVGPGRGRAALSRLVRAGLVAPTRDGVRPVAPLPLARAALPDPSVAERALAWLDAATTPRARLDALRLRLALGRPDAPSRVLEEAPRAIERGLHDEVERWVAEITTAHPGVARVVRARLLERQGRLREALALAREASVAGDDPRGPGAARLDVARLAWRAGRAREASAALRGLGRGEGAQGALRRSEVAELRAAMALERGEPDVARRFLALARDHAERSGDDEALAGVLARVGALEARAGRPSSASGAYRAALAAVRDRPRLRDPGLVPRLLSNLATTEAWLGRHDESERLYREALARRAGQPIEQLNTRAALALLDAARGRRAPGGSFGPLVLEAERVGEPRLGVELAVYRAEELALEGNPEDADRALAKARASLASLGGAELVLDAMVEVAEGVVRARRGLRAAHAALEAGIDRLVAVGARYHAARAARLAATASTWLGDEARALAYLARSADLADPSGIVLGDELSHAVALALAATGPEGAARAHAIAALERCGAVRVEAALRRAGLHDLAERWSDSQGASAGPGAPFRALGRDGARAISAAERELLCLSRDAIVLDRSRALLFVRGGPPRSLARMRHVEPLLAHLAARRPEVASLEELARLVWQQRPTRSVVAAITTSIARARRILGAEHVVVTFGTGSRRAYAIAPDAPFWRIDEKR